MRKYYLILLFLSILSVYPAKGGVEIRSAKITTTEGLANNSTRHIFQDSKGFIWMSTLNGLSRYDGNSFVTFLPDPKNKLSLADHRITWVTEGKNGFLWIATAPELYSCYDLKKDCFVDFTGNGEMRQRYSHLKQMPNGDVWLWHESNGCRKVVYRDGKFSSTVFKKERGNLPSDKVKFVIEGHKGTVWIGTDDGLVRVENDKSSIALSHVVCARITYHNQTLYMVSADGQVYAAGTDGKVKSVIRIFGKEKVFSSMHIQHYWVVFTDKAGYVFNMNTRKVENDKPQFNIPGCNAMQDNVGNWWVFNRTGRMWHFNSKTLAVKAFQLMPQYRMDFIDEERYHVVQDERGIIWISTYGNGLFAYDTHTGQLQHFSHNLEGTSPVSSDFLLYVMEDRTGDIWVSSEFSGISHLSVVNEGASRFFPADERQVDRSNTIRMLHRMDNGDIWMGSRTGRLYQYDASLKQLKMEKDFHSNIYSVHQAKDGTLWIGTRGNGLCVGGKWYVNNPSDASTLTANHIYDICEDNKGRVWLATFGGGLNLAVKQGDSYTFWNFFNQAYMQRQMRVLKKDAKGWLWAGCSDGLYVFHPDSLLANPRSYYHYNNENQSLKTNEVRCICRDSKGRMWIGLAGGGFALCTIDKGYGNITFKYYTTANGLCNNIVEAIVEDRHGDLWIATEYGVSRFNVKKSEFTTFFFSTTILGNVYCENTGCMDKSGRILFGTNYGLTVIDPDKVSASDKISPVTLTNLLVNGTPVHPGDAGSPLEQSLSYSNEIRLKYNQNSFEIDFSTFDYAMSNQTKYTYKLDNYDKEWSALSPLNFAAYKNLSPGTYTLHVKACNSSGVWTPHETTLKIVVEPPFWRTTWAFLLYVVLLAALGYLAYRLMFNFNSLRNRIQVEKQLTEYKLVFFTNISHEFRTPLTLIQGALEKMENYGRLPKELAESVKLMSKSTQRMLRLVNQLLEFRKMQNNKLALSLEETDVVAFLHEIFLSFNSVAESKNMHFTFVPSQPYFKMFVDKNKLDKIVYNILSNAFKYTPSGGNVSLTVQVDGERKQLEITCTDSGVGIPKEKQGELFSRFMQSSFSHNSVGIGLHLTHELVNVHKGSITFKENPTGGAVFTVTLPTDPAVYQEKDFLVPGNLLEEENKKEVIPANEPELVASAEATDKPINKKKILIIEDDNDIREYLKNEMNPYFEVAAEADGQAGLKKAQSYDADLIICDVLMPGMNGFEVTKRLKGDFGTSHIPIILLTAMSSNESHLQGVESGADAYITKPFSPKLLLARVQKLLEQRERLREKFSNSLSMKSPTICTSSRDKEFADKIDVIISKRISDPQFSVEEFASIMGLGRTVFYRKVRGITGYSPNEYIRLMRMKKAAAMILEGKLTISEIAFRVGINDPFYFSKCFKNQFGVPPSAYGKEAKEGEAKDKTEPTA